MARNKRYIVWGSSNLRSNKKGASPRDETMMINKK
jgi:hypothetical protein